MEPKPEMSRNPVRVNFIMMGQANISTLLKVISDGQVAP
jgi:hypothetical protein